MRSIGVSLGVAGVALWLALVGGGVALAAAPAAGPALNQLQATQAAVTQMQQNPPSVPDDVPHAKDINEASRQFMAWQAEMFRQRDEIARKQAKMLHDRMKVPPPLPPSEPEPPMTRLDIPLPFWPANVNLSVSMGEPSVSFSVGAEAEALSCVGASYKVETAYVAKENRWTVADPLEISASFGTDTAEVTGSYQLLTSVFTGSPGEEGEKKKEIGGELSFDIFQVTTAFGYNNQREFSMGVGYDFVSTPEKFSKYFRGFRWSGGRDRGPAGRARADPGRKEQSAGGYCRLLSQAHQVPDRAPAVPVLHGEGGLGLSYLSQHEKRQLPRLQG